MSNAKKMVEAQAKNPALWFVARTAPEGYLQEQLRALHAAVEEDSKQRAEVDASERYRRIYEHYFKTPDATTGDPHRECCAQCGLNIRDAIHKRSDMNPPRSKED